MDRIYFDHAATTPLDKEVFEQMRPYFCDLFGNADSPHFHGRKAMAAVDNARDTVASLIGAHPSEIYFTSGGTESDNWAVIGLARAAAKQGRKKVLVSAVEHHAVLAAAKKLELEGFSVTYLPVNKGGMVEVNALLDALDTDVGVVAVMTANNETGVINPIRELASEAKKFGAVFFTDAVQAAPYMRLSVDELGVDALSFSAHKFFGPKGVGVLYLRKKTKIEPYLAGGEQERGLRGGTVNVPLVVGLASAYEKAVREMQENAKKIAELKEAFLEKVVKELDGVFVNGEGEKVPSVLNLRFEGVDNATFLYDMDLQGVSLAAGSACASASVQPSHVLTALGLTEREAKESVRFSFGKDNTMEEIERGAYLTVETVKKLRKG